MPAVTHLGESSGTKIVHNKLCTGTRCENHRTPCRARPMLRSSSALFSLIFFSVPSSLILFFVAWISSLSSFSSSLCLPSHLQVLASVLILLIIPRGSPGPVLAGVTPALQWEHLLESLPFIWSRSHRASIAL